MSLQLGLKLGSDPFAHGALRLDDYVVDGAPEVPTTVTVPGNGFPWGMLGNDSAGDCFEAAILHIDETFNLKRGAVPTPWQPSSAIELYSAIEGYDPNQTQPDGSNPTDTGTDPSKGMAWWVQHGAAGDTPTSKPGIHALAGFGQLPATSPNIRRAIWEFSAVLFCLALPDSWQSMVDSNGVANFTGSTPGDPQNGHAIVGNAFTPEAFDIVTWGKEGIMANGFAAVTLEQVFVPLSREGLNTAGVGPAGFAFAKMLADLPTLGSVN
jgi:hypothetical protein